MNIESKSFVTYIEENAKLPRENGEIIFHTPWESRIFAMAVLLYQKGFYHWTDFNGEFVKEIGEHEAVHPDTDVVSTYYSHWIQAFEKVLIHKDMMTSERLLARTDEFMSGDRNHVC